MANYTTKAKISALTGIAEASIESDWLNWSDEEIEQATGEEYSIAVSEILKIDGPGGNVLILPKYPILTITKINCDGVEWTGVDITNSFAIYEDEGMIKVREGINYDNVDLDEVFAKGTQNIEITGTFGYASVPKIIEELATLIVIRIMREKSLGMTDEITDESIGDYSVKYRENKYDLIKTIEDLFALISGNNITGESV
jgi:hypothetical protein